MQSALSPRELNRQPSLVAAVAFAAEQLLGDADWQVVVPDVLGRLGLAADVSRVDLLELCPTEHSLEIIPRYEWVAAHRGAADALAGGGIPWCALSRWEAILRSGATIHGSVRELPPRERGALERQGVRSIAVIPVRDGSRCWGALRFVDCRMTRQWTAVEVEVFRTAATAFGAALGRRRLDEALRLSRKRARQLARRRAAAVRAARVCEEMLATVAHDLRNPLNTMYMGCSLLLDVTTTAEQPVERKQLKLMHRAGQRMKRLIQDLLDARRLDGRLAVLRRPEPITTILDEALELMRPLADAEGIELVCDPSSVTATVFVDPARIHQVLSNLIGNAIKFTPRGGRITLCAKSDGRDVVVAVTDTGAGIARHELPHIFGRFWQGRRTDTRGIGLGLAITKAIVEAHGGQVWVESDVCAGSTFYFRLPIHSAGQ